MGAHLAKVEKEEKSKLTKIARKSLIDKAVEARKKQLKINYARERQKKYGRSNIRPYNIPDGFLDWNSQIFYQCLRSVKSC